MDNKYTYHKVDWNTHKSSAYTYRVSIDEITLLSPEELDDWASDGGYKLITPSIEYLVEDKDISPLELRVLLYIGTRVVGQNIVFVTIKDIMDGLQIDKTQVSRMVKSLEDKGYITVDHKNTFGVGSRVISVNPSLFWKGNYGTRQKYQMDWYMKGAVSIEERLYSCPLLL